MAEIEVSVECEKCGAVLDATVKYGSEIHVTPCESCMSEERNRGYDDGYEEAKKEEASNG